MAHYSNSSVDLEGFQGKGCADVAKALQGSDAVKNLRNKREFYVQGTETRRQQERA